jgi:hypothetical protein
MRTRIRIVLAIGVVASAVFMNGCLFNLFQTARMLGSGNVAITLGSGFMDVVPDDDADWALTPQARLAVGITDTIDFGMQTGAFVPLTTGDFGWLGAKGDLKFSIVDDPETFSLAMGFGAGYGAEFLNWGLFGEVLFDVNSTIPLFFVYQPTIPLQADSFAIWHHVAGGLKLRISPTTVLLLIVDYRNPQLFSFGLAIEIGL